MLIQEDACEVESLILLKAGSSVAVRIQGN